MFCISWLGYARADRQRTLRELELGRTLFKEGERWVIRHQAADYKTGRSYGERPPMAIAPHVYPEVGASAAMSGQRALSRVKGAQVVQPLETAQAAHTKRYGN